MQEANETTASHSAKSDLDVQKLKVENEKLKEELATCRQELEAENRQLQEEVTYVILIGILPWQGLAPFVTRPCNI